MGIIFSAAGCKEDDVKVDCAEEAVIADSNCACHGADFQGKCISNMLTLGNYYQSSGETKEPIQWNVLTIDKRERKMLVISKYILDAKPYHDAEVEEITWEKSSLRKWLNEDFINAAFTQEEQGSILTTSLKNLENPVSHIPGGNNTEDRIFLFSLGDALTSNDSLKIDDNNVIHGNEVEGGHYFWSGSSRATKATQYALDHFADSAFGVIIASGDHFAGNRSACSNLQCTAEWWLRSPGSLEVYAASVLCGKFDGDVLDAGQHMSTQVGVRPALWIKY